MPLRQPSYPKTCARCVLLVPAGPYHFPSERRDHTLDGVTKSVKLITRRDRQIIRHASHFPVAGEKGVAVEQVPIEDRYLLAYPDRRPPFENHWEGFYLLAKGDNARLLHVADAPDPFLGDRAREKLFQIQSREWKVYSLYAAT